MAERGVFTAPFKTEMPEKASMTLLSHIDVCPFSGALYVKHKGGPQTPRMAGGELIHQAIETCIGMMIEQGEMSIPSEVAKDVAQALIEERVDLALPAEEQDLIRLACWNWAYATVIDPSTVIGVEVMLEMEVAGIPIRGKLDLCEIVDNEGIVTDWKSSLWMPSAEEYSRNFQAQVYALLLCEGTVEGEEIPLGKRLAGVHTKQVFPRFDPRKRDNGELPTRSAYFDRAQLADFKRTLESHLAKLAHGVETSEWVASPGSHCQRCPASAECPIPAHVRKVTTIGTDGDAQEIAARVLLAEEARKADMASLKAWADENGAIRVGDIEFNYSFSESERADKPAIKAALEAAGLDPDDYFKKSPSTRFGKAKVKA